MEKVYSLSFVVTEEQFKDKKFTALLLDHVDEVHYCITSKEYGHLVEGGVFGTHKKTNETPMKISNFMKLIDSIPSKMRDIKLIIKPN